MRVSGLAIRVLVGPRVVSGKASVRTSASFETQKVSVVLQNGQGPGSPAFGHYWWRGTSRWCGRGRRWGASKQDSGRCRPQKTGWQHLGFLRTMWGPTGAAPSYYAWRYRSLPCATHPLRSGWRYRPILGAPRSIREECLLWRYEARERGGWPYDKTYPSYGKQKHLLSPLVHGY